MANFQINDIVRVNRLPYDRDVFLIVADRNNHWNRNSPYKPNIETVEVKEGFDFILIKKKGKLFGCFNIPDEGLHVTENELTLIKKLYIEIKLSDIQDSIMMQGLSLLDQIESYINNEQIILILDEEGNVIFEIISHNDFINFKIKYNMG